MRYLIIGLGIYGSNLAVDLTEMGHEVIAADIKPMLVENLKDKISATYILDSTDEAAISVLPLKNVDIVIVAIGENFGASIKTVALLKKLGVQHIYARAMDELHHSILEGFNIDCILNPEQRAAHALVNELALGSRVESMKVDNKNFILKFTVPDFFVGTAINSIDFRDAYHLRLIAITRPVMSTNIMGLKHLEYQSLDPSADPIFEKDDVVICYGTYKAFNRLYESINS